MLTPPISRLWTLEERVRVVQAMLTLIQDDIYAGTYSVPGRPNITSVQHIFGEPVDVLESYRADIEAMIAPVEARVGGPMYPARAPQR